MSRALRVLTPVCGLALVVASTSVVNASAVSSALVDRPVDNSVTSDVEHVLQLRDRLQERRDAAPQPPAVPDIIRAAFTPLGPDAVTWAERVAFCESTYDPNAVNPSSGTEGLFQFMPSTWAESPEAGSSPFDPTANSQAAAWLYNTVGPNQWECQ